MELWELHQMQSLPLKAKISMTQQRIREWYEYWDGQVFVSFSGGKDSEVLVHIVRDMYPDVPAVFADTGLEFPEIKEFVRNTPNVTIVRPELSFKQVIEKYGYPVVSKEQAQWVERARGGNPDVMVEKIYGVRKTGEHSNFSLSPGWRHLFNAPFKISSQCCNEMKKKPMKKYTEETGRKPYVATMAAESKLRTQVWLHQGCNAFDAKKPVSKPMSFWLEQDVWDYIHENNLPYCKAYDMGYQRTGCIFCMFGAHLDEEPTRFQRLQKTHPKLWRYCMKDWDAGGLGMRPVLEYLGIPYENYQLEGAQPSGNTEDSGDKAKPGGVQSEGGTETR